MGNERSLIQPADDKPPQVPPPFQAGDLVQLRSGSSPMTVGNLQPDGKGSWSYGLFWHDATANRVVRDNVPAVVLMPADQARAPKTKSTSA